MRGLEDEDEGDEGMWVMRGRKKMRGLEEKMRDERMRMSRTREWG